jgi:uncharacterized surface protein with fasciclin (FAS1) repeats
MLVYSTILTFFVVLASVGPKVHAFYVSGGLSLKRSHEHHLDAVKDSSEVESHLTGNYATFSKLMLKQDALWKKLRETEQYTLFVPTESVFQALGQQKMNQLQDPRNGETTEKILSYHCINEAVSADDLFSCGGVISLGGTVPVSRTVSGGVFGLGGTEDGGVKVQGARVLRSFQVSNCIIHEVDSLISPQLLWRYMDQLRIPFSK